MEHRVLSSCTWAAGLAELSSDLSLPLDRCVLRFHFRRGIKLDKWKTHSHKRSFICTKLEASLAFKGNLDLLWQLNRRI